jgi:hypothetical protein
MVKITTEAGHTQIGKVLINAKNEAAKQPVGALVYVGDFCEEYAGELFAAARNLRTPMFLFQEGDDLEAKAIFQELARLTSGAYARFDLNAGSRLRDLLASAALFAAGGVKALGSQQNDAVRTLLTQLKNIPTYHK